MSPDLFIASGVVHLTGYVVDEIEGFPDDYDDGDVDSGLFGACIPSVPLSVFLTAVNLSATVSMNYVILKIKKSDF